MILQYLHPKIKLSETKTFNESFKTLPHDQHVQEGFRQRAYTRFDYDPNSKSLSKLPHQPFVQDSKYNSLFGNVKREFAELEREVAESDNLRLLVASLTNSCELTAEKVEIGVHQIRISCSPTTEGNPVPEGIHQDGYQYVGIYCLARENVTGGVTTLHQTKDSQPFFEKILNPGDFLIFNDEQLFHFTSPIRPASDKLGFRDVLILTAKQVN